MSDNIQDKETINENENEYYEIPFDKEICFFFVINERYTGRKKKLAEELHDRFSEHY